MISTIKSTALFGDPSDRRAPQGQDERDGGQPQRQPQPERDIRLLIEADESGVLTYRLIDRASGAVISVVSRDDLLKMVSDPAYTAGKVISTKA